MQYMFSTEARHWIAEANYSYYTIPTMHPSRNMEVHDFIYMLDGEWTIGQEGETFTMRNDDVLLLQANTDHYGVMPCQAGTRTMFLHVSREAGDSVYSGTEELRQTLLRSHTNAADNPNIRSFFEKIIFAKSEGNDAKATTYFEALLYELSELSAKEQGENLASGIRSRIMASSDTIPKNSDLAAHFHVSVKTAENAFKSAYRMTIHQFVLKVKIRQAQSYLTNFPEMKLSEVARNLGFYDEYHLSRQFKRSFGLSPSEFRKQHKK